VTDKPKRLEDAQFERAETAIEWEVADDKAEKSGRPADQAKAAQLDAALDAADRKIKTVKAEPE
jgi:hypothetical protein